CGRKLDLGERDLCVSCYSDLPFTLYWSVAANPMADTYNSLIQKRIEKGEFVEPYQFACALFFYRSEEGYSNIPQSLKYYGNIRAGRNFGRLLGRHLAESPLYFDVDMVIPVPLHLRRLWKRGYNQAEIIAAEVARALGSRLERRLLARGKFTKTQTRLSREEKNANVRNAFRLRKRRLNLPYPRHILLVDDVFTTGATLFACYSVLRTVFPPYIRISLATLAYTGDQ
ncbi:MAG: ComF family protein, partial [Bacteroidales bacterium]|nr:ComF family protein [Bacteroidales bacterium]